MRLVYIAWKNLYNRSWQNRVAMMQLLAGFVAIIFALALFRGITFYQTLSEEMKLNQFINFSSLSSLFNYGKVDEQIKLGQKVYEAILNLRGIEYIGLVARGVLEIDGIGRVPYYAIDENMKKLLPLKVVKGINYDFNSIITVDFDSVSSYASALLRGRSICLKRIPVLVGSKLGEKLIPGTVFYDELMGGKSAGYCYEVTGVIEKGTYYLSNWEGDLYRVLPNIDFAVIMAKNDYLPDYIKSTMYIGGIWTSVKTKEEFNQLVPQWKEALSRYGVEVQPFSKMLKDFYRNRQEPIRRIFIIGGLIMILAIFGFSGVNALSILLRKREFGIHFACGARKRELLIIVFIESLFLVFLPGTIAIILLKVVDSIPVLEKYLPYFIVDKYVIGMALLIILGILMVTTIAPILQLKRESPVNLIRGTKN
ncbi:hypothetical protein BBF96_05975 [Anoxybacter fermentans]|uniref:ABC3 transporter permease C-terminal domain-containing protein n=1 Tax=Anoxybacter fermentans TaxID=1323375 RepID=A0A3Q9HQ17_9FIRM|nr:ABC transporter permease [Anoxybacter fermentans]AZR72980.1 hypothetical protein BBF96_05975 [Anoxybacter fermentans]